MSTSGEFFANPNLRDLTEEAFERISKDPEGLTARHAKSARRSLSLMLMEWSNMEDRQNFIERMETPLVQNQSYFDMPEGSLDLILINVRRADVEIPIEMISRDEWMAIPDKSFTGRPDRVFVEKMDSIVRVHLWPIEEQNNLDTMVYYRLKLQQTAGGAQNIAQAMIQYSDALAAGLAARLSEKFAPDLEEKMYAKAARALDLASQATRERVDVNIKFAPDRGKW